MKFGGTSVGDGARIQKVADLVQREIVKGHQIVVVASAMSGVTNMLIEAAKLAARGDESLIADTRRRLFTQHIAAVNAISAQGGVQDRLVAELDRRLTVFENLGRSVHILGELTARGLDAISSLGESLCVSLVAPAIRDGGLA